MITITRQLQFDAGHRVLGHEGKCANLHGHRYVAEIEVRSPTLDSIGRVVDFGVVKEKVGQWIDENWDHNLILNKKDPLCGMFHSFEREYQIMHFGPKIPFMMPNGNPTAENMAEWLFKVAENLIPVSLEVVSVTIHETPNCKAKYQP